jgi:hypothetical protein
LRRAKSTVLEEDEGKLFATAESGDTKTGAGVPVLSSFEHTPAAAADLVRRAELATLRMRTHHVPTPVHLCVLWHLLQVHLLLR